MLALLLAVLTASAACGRRAPPPAPPPVKTQPASPRVPDLPTVPVPAPLLDVWVEPSVINAGESALLSWEARHADRVVISHNIGAVETRGRIKFFPDQTTSYQVSAEGPGGRVDKLVTVQVLGAPAADLRSEDLPRSLPEEFERFVQPVFFDYDKAELTDTARRTLDQNIAWLTQMENSEVRFIVEGHCDERGTEEYNLALGDRRAQVVLAYLVGAGIGRGRIRTVSYGEERPFDTRQSEEGWAQNRRAHFVFIE